MKSTVRQRFVPAVFISLAVTNVATAVGADGRPTSHDYDIVYVRAPRYGDEKNTAWPEIKDPIQMEPGADLMLLHPDGNQGNTTRIERSFSIRTE